MYKFSFTIVVKLFRTRKIVKCKIVKSNKNTKDYNIFL